MTNKEKQGKEFGDLVDIRASDPVKIISTLGAPPNQEKSRKESTRRQ